MLGGLVTDFTLFSGDFSSDLGLFSGDFSVDLLFVDDANESFDGLDCFVFFDNIPARLKMVLSETNG